MKYPNDIFVSQTSTKTFSISAFFQKRSAEEDSPMMIFDDNFSRFVFSIVTKGEGGLNCNIKPSDIAGIDKATDACYALQIAQDSQSFTAPAQEGSIDTSGPAFQKKFMVGNLKGKAPAEILIENGWEEGKKILNNQYSWLKDNLQKFPKNKELMDAIVAASKLDPEKLAKLGGSEAQATGSRKPVTILDIGMRPLIRKKRQDGKSPVYEGKVIWDFSHDRYPVNITIKNYWAPVNVNANGTLNVLAGQKTEEKSYNFSLSASQWADAVRIMKSRVEIFERICMPEAIKSATNAYMANLEAAKNQGQQQQ